MPLGISGAGLLYNHKGLNPCDLPPRSLLYLVLELYLQGSKQLHVDIRIYACPISAIWDPPWNGRCQRLRDFLIPFQRHACILHQTEICPAHSIHGWAHQTASPKLHCPNLGQNWRNSSTWAIPWPNICHYTVLHCAQPLQFKQSVLAQFKTMSPEFPSLRGHFFFVGIYPWYTGSQSWCSFAMSFRHVLLY